MNFSKQKKDFLSKPDKSKIGKIDEGIKNLVSLINERKDYYTTSSCAGRIILIEEGKKKKNAFIFVTHKEVSLKEIKDLIKQKKSKKMIYLKEEPCILHVASKAIERGFELVNLARQCGWKKSGIISLKKEKIMIELISTEILAAPILYKGKILVQEKYLNVLIKECNKKLKQTREKIKNFEKAFKLMR